MTCQRCGGCCTFLIVEAGVLDALREPAIARVCRLPVPEANVCDVDEHDDPIHVDPWQGRVAALAPRHSGKDLLPCPFLVRDGESLASCVIYPTRPNGCVGFAPGGQQCREAQAHMQRLQQETPEVTA